MSQRVGIAPIIFELIQEYEGKTQRPVSFRGHCRSYGDEMAGLGIAHSNRFSREIADVGRGIMETRD
jgi:hypothetical protein